tara:strand:- start:880 stop:2211 length:1332 start_codon:yes stop_codon:yes gene_type:complete
MFLKKFICFYTSLFVAVGSSACSAEPKGKSLPETPSSSDISAKEAALFYAHVADRVRREHVENVENSKLLEGALNGMLSSLDPHSSYLDAKKFHDIQKQAHGEYGGLGLEVIMDEGVIRIVSPIEDTPADKAGLKPDDLIIAIDEESVYGLTIFEASEKLRGKPESTVKILVRRENVPPFELTLKRENIKVIPVKSRREGNIGYIRITTFNERVVDSVKSALEKLKTEIGPDQLQGYILDVRNNPGGLFEECIDLTDLFLSQGEIVSIRGRNTDQKRSFMAQKKDITVGIPLVVLINGGSASASEILAGALQDHKRALIVGTKSFGKGSVQTVIPMTNGGAIKITTARYYTPSGRSIQKTGIIPDIEIEQQVDIKSINEASRYRESDLKGALGQKSKESEGDRAAKREKKTDSVLRDVTDYQLQQALNILRAVSLQNKLRSTI